MECCSSYNDYRHGIVGPSNGNTGVGGGGFHHHHHPYNSVNPMRYSQTQMYHGAGGIRPPPLPPSPYDSYEQYGYPNVPSAYVGYGNSNFNGFNQNSIRENGFYSHHHHHHPFDSYRMSPAYSYHNSHHPPLPPPPPTPQPPPSLPTHHLNHHLHHRDPYNMDLLYGPSSRSNYAARDSPFQYAMYNGIGKEFYPPQHSMPSSAIADSPIHHPNGSIYGEYPMAPATPFPIGSGNFPSAGFGSATGYGMASKDSKLRKGLRDKNLTKLAAMNKKLESSTPMIHDMERAGTPFVTNHHHNPTCPPESFSNENFNHNLRFHNDHHMPSSGQFSNWHLNSNSPSPVNSGNWTNGTYGARQNHRKRMISPNESQLSPMTPSSIRPPSQSSATKESQKIVSEVFESDFIPSKKKRKNKISSEDLCSSREELQNITPLPGFQQAFGSTEIGRFSEIFFNAPESPAEFAFESEGDTLSPQLWETGDSLEGPHINLQVGATVQPVYAESYTSNDSPASNSYFSEIRCGDY